MDEQECYQWADIFVSPWESLAAKDHARNKLLILVFKCAVDLVVIDREEPEA